MSRFKRRKRFLTKLEEIEDYCNGNGMELAFKVRTTF